MTAGEDSLVDLLENESRLRLLVEQIPARIGIIDRDLRVLWDIGGGFIGASCAGKLIAEIFPGPPDRDRVLDGVRKALSGKSCELEAVIGGRSAQLRLAPFREQSGKIVGAMCVALDVTDRKRAEAALQESQRMLLEAQRIGQVRAWEENLSTGTIKTELATFLGSDAMPYDPRPKEEAWKLVHPDDRPKLMELRRRILEEQGPFETEYRLLHPDGLERVVFVRGELVRDANGKPERILGTALDITDRARAEQAVRKSQHQLLEAQALAHVGSWERDPRTDRLELSEEARRILFGDDPRTLTSSEQFIACVHPDDRERIFAQREKCERETKPWDFEYRIVRPDGAVRWVHARVQVERDDRGRMVRIHGTNLDITERKETEEALRKSQRLLVDAERLGNAGSFERDLVTGEVFQTEGSRRVLFGDDRSKGEKFEDWATALHPDDRESVLRLREQLINEGWPREIEYRVVWPDGSEHVILSRATVVRDQDGRPIRIYGTNVDVTERKQAEEELKRRAQQQAAVAQLSLSALRGDDLQPLFQEAADLVSRTLGVEYGVVGEWIADKQLMEFRAGVGPWIAEIVRRVTISTAPGLMSWFYMRSKLPVVVSDLVRETRFTPCELLMAHGVRSVIAVPIGGKERPFGVLEANSKKLRAFSDDEVNFVWSMANVLANAIEQKRAAADARDRREQLQALSHKLIQAQEAERHAIARELHDDFGQVLTALKLNLNRRQVDTADSIALVDGALARMRDLAQDLRPPLLDDLGLEASLNWYVEREAKRAGLECHLRLDPLATRPPLSVETTCFRVAQEALTNVIRHAQARRVEVELRTAGGALQLAILDDGRGFDVAAARRRASRGESQGLLNMQERVALAGGELEIESAPGSGTAIRARFPPAVGSAR